MAFLRSDILLKLSTFGVLQIVADLQRFHLQNCRSMLVDSSAYSWRVAIIKGYTTYRLVVLTSIQLGNLNMCALNCSCTFIIIDLGIFVYAILVICACSRNLFRSTSKVTYGKYWETVGHELVHVMDTKRDHHFVAEEINTSFHRRLEEFLIHALSTFFIAHECCFLHVLPLQQKKIR